jgi:hypothetical protein
MTTATPGISEYKVRLKDQSGILIAEFDNWLSLNFNHRQNFTSSIRFEIDGRDERVSLFELDGQIEVWRRNPSIDLDWYVEWEGFFRTPNDLIIASDDERFVAHGKGYLDLLKRAYVQWPVGSSEATKSGIGETIIKEIASENIGSLALASAGRQRDHVFPGFNIEGDAGRGLSWSGAFADKQCSSIIRQIAEATGLVVDIVGTGAALFELRIYEEQRGEDRSSTSSNPLIFSTEFGNMETPLLSINRGEEVTAATAIGQGVETDKRKRTKTSSATGDSPWNDIEGLVNASQATSNAELDSAADAELQAKKKIESLSFNVLQTASSFYGKDYTWGTKATAKFKDYSEDIVIDNVNITINGQTGNENITIRFSNENLVQ